MGINEEAWFVIFVQRAKSHPSAMTEWPRRMPIMRLQIFQQRNPPFQLIEGLAIHGLLASTGGIQENVLIAAWP